MLRRGFIVAGTMDFLALARHFVCMIVAATLSLTVSVVERMLPQRPEWLEKIALLEAQFRALSTGETGAEADTVSPASSPPSQATSQATSPPTSPGGPPAPSAAQELPVDLQGLVDGYGKLLAFTQQVKIRGLMLDADFCERVEREWSVKTLLSYMISAEKSLKEQAAEAHEAAANHLSSQR